MSTPRSRRAFLHACCERATLLASGPTASAGYFDNPKFKDGDFGLLDTNWGDVVPAIDAGWDPESRGKRIIHEAGQLQPR